MMLIRALLLEDSLDDAELLILELERSGFVVEWTRVENEHDFLSNLTSDLDIILADYTLPQFDAERALALLKKSIYDVPLIVVTGTVSEETAVFCMKLGAADYLLKDRLSRLGEAVRQAIAQHELRLEQQHAERELRILNHAVNSSTNGVILADLTGTITFVNGAVLGYWGYERQQDIVGRSLAELWPEFEDGKAIIAAVRQNNSVLGEVLVGESSLSILTLQYSISVVLEANGSELCLMGMFLDITQQKKNIQTRRDAERLRIALDQAKALQDLKSRFMSMVVHDFRNPLTIIQLKLSGLRKYFERLSPQQRIERIDASLEEIRHLNQLTEDVLTISRLESNASTLNLSAHDITTFFKEIFDGFKENLSEDHNLVYQGPTESITMSLDRSLMRRVILNLLSNAVKYSPPKSTVYFKGVSC